MVKRCVLGGCTNTNQSDVSVHTFPSDSNLKKRWDDFVSLTRSDWRGGRSGISVICGAHFVAPDDFIGFLQWRAGFRRKLDLVKGAVPSVLPPGLFSPSRKRGRQKPRWPTNLNATMTNGQGRGCNQANYVDPPPQNFQGDPYNDGNVSSLTTQQIRQFVESTATGFSLSVCTLFKQHIIIYIHV